MTRKARKRGAFGTAHKLPSGRYRAMYHGPDGRRYKAPTLFLTEKDARGWLALQQADIIKKVWTPPEALAAETAPARKALTFKGYADDWLRHRQVKGRPLKDRTREHYRDLLDDHILPTFGALPLASITGDDVRDWYQRLDPDTPTLRAHCYGLLRTILGTAAANGKIAANPATITGAGSVKRVHTPRPASVYEVQAIAWEMPRRYRAMVMLAAWCALRFGELTELRRRDVLLSAPDDDPEGVVRIVRGVVRTEDGFKSTTPKSDAGIRDVSVPPHIVPVLRGHLEQFVDDTPSALLFPADHGGHMAPATLYRHFYKARDRVGRPDLRWHDLRHTGADLAAVTGATLADLMGRLGHSTPAAAMRYQHASQARDRELAAKLSKLAGQ
ncbi:site-specific integrase [Mycolicibacterium sp.]|uniref:tyrosine-type recombinase/integrase n=1 Tax=Mycolicibacterium sp. TaxID=2320850 RepID=UPI0025D4458D|nr:site-specific integrase [Mycolicibacterium sp.]